MNPTISDPSLPLQSFCCVCQNHCRGWHERGSKAPTLTVGGGGGGVYNVEQSWMTGRTESKITFKYSIPVTTVPTDHALKPCRWRGGKHPRNLYIGISWRWLATSTLWLGHSCTDWIGDWASPLYIYGDEEKLRLQVIESLSCSMAL
jgi:hypothetical protein